MPKTDRTREESQSDGLVLAAIERAERHPRGDQPGVLLATVKEHLGLARGGWSTRQLRPKLEALEAAGLIEQSRRHSLNLWGLTSTGRRRLDSARNAHELGTLPEAPQHRAWREARSAAGDRVAEFREDLRRALDQATDLLDAQAQSGTYFELGARLQRACARLGSAIYCLNEWPEPDDTRADIDDPPFGHGGRRNPRAWDN